MIENQDTIYKTLLKVNQIGKKLASHSIYILSNGIMMSFSHQEMSDTIANPVSIALIDKSLYKKLEGIGDNIGLEINGNLLYKYSQEYEFDNIEIIKDGININFVYYSINENSYDNNFKKLLLDKGFKDDEISYASTTNYTSNMDMYDLFLDYKKKYQPTKEKTYISVLCKYAKTDSIMYKKPEKIINKLLEFNNVYDQDISKEIFDVIFNACQPITRKFELSTGKILKIRLMKSIFNPITTKSTIAISIYEKDNDYILIAKTEITGISIFNIYQILDF